MSNKFISGGTDLSNKFYMISQPMHISHFADDDEDEDGEETASYHWLARSRKLQARRWREIKRQEI